jgi:type II secretory pathway pseudopilin PulG
VVISIITLLMGLILPAVQRVRVAAQRAEAVTEISQLGIAATNFSNEVGGQLPLTGGGPNGEFRLCTRYTDAAGQPLTEVVAGVPRQWPEIAQIKALFPLCDLNDTGLRRGYRGPVVPTASPDLLDGNQALVFWLTGGSYCEFRGFSTNRSQPLTPPLPVVPGQKAEGRKGPFTSLQPNRLVDPATGQYDGRYRDVWGTPVAVFGWDKGLNDYPDVTLYGVKAYRTAKPDGTAGRAFNHGAVQIVSAGYDRKFGPGGLYTPAAGAWSGSKPGADDLSTFRTGQLGSDGD